jgi:hypothetical protein
MSNWPVITPEAYAERNQIIASHRPLPLPAYDINGHLIPPDQCQVILPGAITRVTFTLNQSFEFDPTENKLPINTFVADVHSV